MRRCADLCGAVRDKPPEEGRPAKPSSIGELIEALPFGRFHVLHISRQILVNACFAITLEIVPYAFQGQQLEFGLTRLDLSLYSALFSGGSIFGAALAALQDHYGRRPIIRVGAVCAALVSLAIGVLNNWATVRARFAAWCMR